MKATQLLAALLLGSALALGAFAATEAPKQPAGKKAGCCVKAAADNNKACGHACCVEAAKANKNCEKCGGTNVAAAPAK
jgi:hypothetical protein